MLVWAGALHSGQFVLNCSTWNTTWVIGWALLRLQTFSWYAGGCPCWGWGRETEWRQSLPTTLLLSPQQPMDSLHFWDPPLLASLLVVPQPSIAEIQITRWHIYLNLPNSLPWSGREDSGLLVSCHLMGLTEKLGSTALIQGRTELKIGITATANFYCKVYPKSWQELDEMHKRVEVGYTG